MKKNDLINKNNQQNNQDIQQQKIINESLSALDTSVQAMPKAINERLYHVREQALKQVIAEQSEKNKYQIKFRELAEFWISLNVGRFFCWNTGFYFVATSTAVAIAILLLSMNTGMLENGSGIKEDIVAIDDEEILFDNELINDGLEDFMLVGEFSDDELYLIEDLEFFYWMIEEDANS